MNTIFKIKKKTFVNGSLLSCKSCKSYNPAQDSQDSQVSYPVNPVNPIILLLLRFTGLRDFLPARIGDSGTRHDVVDAFG